MQRTLLSPSQAFDFLAIPLNFLTTISLTVGLKFGVCIERLFELMFRSEIPSGLLMGIVDAGRSTNLSEEALEGGQ